MRMPDRPPKSASSPAKPCRVGTGQKNGPHTGAIAGDRKKCGDAKVQLRKKKNLQAL
jgi:hypothetical protein